MESGLTNHCAMNRKTHPSLRTFTARDFEALQTYHVSADFKPVEYTSLRNRYNAYLLEVLRQFAQGWFIFPIFISCVLPNFSSYIIHPQESQALKSYLDEDNILWVLQKEETCRMRFLAHEIRNGKTNSKEDADEFLILYERYQVALHRLAVDAHGKVIIIFT